MAEKPLECLKAEIENAVVHSIEETILFVVETAASDYTVFAA